MRKKKIGSETMVQKSSNICGILLYYARLERIEPPSQNEGCVGAMNFWGTMNLSLKRR